MNDNSENKITNIDNVKYEQTLIFYNEDNLCVVCFDKFGNTQLCSKCKFKYCDDCAIILKNKCCICFRINKNLHDHLDEYANNDYFEDNQETDQNVLMIVIKISLQALVMGGIILSVAIGLCYVVMILIDFLFWIIYLIMMIIKIF